MSDDLKPGSRVLLVERPDGTLTRHLPLIVGNLYVVDSLEGSNVRLACDDPAIGVVSFSRSRVRLVTPWTRPAGASPGVWVCECGDVRFQLVRTGKGWRGKAFFDGDEVMTTTGRDRNAALVELHAMVRHLRAEREATRHHPGA